MLGGLAMVADKVEPAMIFSVVMTGQYDVRFQENAFVRYKSSERRKVLRKHGFFVSNWAMEDLEVSQMTRILRMTPRKRGDIFREPRRRSVATEIGGQHQLGSRSSFRRQDGGPINAHSPITGLPGRCCTAPYCYLRGSCISAAQR